MDFMCKRCGGEVFSKTGIVRNKQRYLCKVCGNNQTIVDRREKYSEQIRRVAIILYLEGVWIS